MKSKIKFSFFTLIAAVYLVLPSVSFAALNVCGGNELPAGQPVTQQNASQFYANSCQLPQIFQLIAKVTNYLVATAGVYAVFLIVVSGFRMVAMSGNEGSVKEARGHLQKAIMGFLLVMLAYLIVNTVFMIFQVKIGISSQYQFPFNPFK